MRPHMCTAAGSRRRLALGVGRRIGRSEHRLARLLDGRSSSIDRAARGLHARLPHTQREMATRRAATAAAPAASAGPVATGASARASAKLEHHVDRAASRDVIAADLLLIGELEGRRRSSRPRNNPRCGSVTRLVVKQRRLRVFGWTPGAPLMFQCPRQEID